MSLVETPSEIICYILTYCNAKQICGVEKVSKGFWKMIHNNDGTLWKQLALQQIKIKDTILPADFKSWKEYVIFLEVQTG
jgi:hypothetical protein